MAHLTKTFRCYKLVTPSILRLSNNALRLAVQRPYSCYFINKPSFVQLSTWINKDCQITLQPIRSYAKIESLELREIEDRVMESLFNYDKMDQEKLTRTAHFAKDLGLDSLDHVELIMAIEEEFGNEIPDADAEKLMTAQDVINYVCQWYIVETPSS